MLYGEIRAWDEIVLDGRRVLIEDVGHYVGRDGEEMVSISPVGEPERSGFYAEDLVSETLAVGSDE